MKVRFVGFPPGADAASIEKGVNASDDVIAAAEKACDYYDRFYNRPHPGHRCQHTIGYRITDLTVG